MVETEVEAVSWNELDPFLSNGGRFCCCCGVAAVAFVDFFDVLCDLVLLLVVGFSFLSSSDIIKSIISHQSCRVVWWGVVTCRVVIDEILQYFIKTCFVLLT